MPRRRDKVSIESDAGTFDKFESLEIVNDLTSPSEAVFEIGDDGAWQELDRIIRPGKLFRVYLNDRLRLTGRAEVNESPGTAEAGVTISLVVRTKLSDARYASADPKVRVEKTSIKDFIVKLFEPLGYTEKDFVFNAEVGRDLLTGKQGAVGAPKDLEPIKLDQAKVNPPETILAAAERHLKRFHMALWDAPDGRIIIGAPDDTQAPYYRLLAKRGKASVANNLLGWKRIRDWSEVAGEVRVFGGTVTNKDVARASLKGVSVDLDLAEAFADSGHFYRPVMVMAEGAKTQEYVDAQARREMSARARRKNAWEFTVDGWSFWNGSDQIPWATNTTADVDIDAADGAAGRFLIHRVSLKLSVDGAATAQLLAVAPGIWEI